MNSNINLMKISLFQSYFALFRVQRANRFTKFDGELGDQQRTSLERIDMKLGWFN